jgi:hypothetical protein
MSEFNPSPNERVVIGGQVYQVMPHPSVPAFAFGQEGRKAFVFQVSETANGGMYALKKFKEAYRVPELVEVCDALARFASWPGLEVCSRQCLQWGLHDDVLNQFPDLEYSVLMPWISGRTWYDIVIGTLRLDRLEALTFASAAAQVLSALEESGLAHCDIAAANVIVNPTTGRAHLIDVEDIYAPGFTPPAALPAGTDGYAHKTASGGLWGSSADRFAGAVLICEMAAWHVPEIRKEAEEEHYFFDGELQQDCPRYRLMYDVLGRMDERLPELFDQAWFSETLDDCPSMRQWQEVIGDVYHKERLSKVVSDWQPLVVPGAAPEVQPESVSPQEPPPGEAVTEVDAGRAEKPLFQPSISTDAGPAISPAGPAVPPPTRPIPAVSSGSGGPVKEWRPLAMPPVSSGNGTASSKMAQQNRPIFDAIVLPPSGQEVESQAADTAGDEFVGHNEPVDAREDLDTDTPRVTLRPILRLSHVEGGRPFLVWSQSPGATHYLIQEADDPDFEAVREYQIVGDDTRWKKPGLRRRRSGKLYYRIRAIAGDQMSAWSDVLEV